MALFIANNRQYLLPYPENILSTTDQAPMDSSQKAERLVLNDSHQPALCVLLQKLTVLVIIWNQYCQKQSI
jgi:hypothetical protein